jgi:RNA polymerase sigma factor (sigma-70 family)
MSSIVASTQWSQVLAARDGTNTEARAALEFLIQTYWHPLYAFIRHRGYSPEESSDLTQAFFTELLEKNSLARVDPQKGRFRSFLLASLRNFLSHERERRGAIKRGGATFTDSLDLETGEQRYAMHLANDQTPEDVFERRWAMTVLDRAIERLQKESSDSPSDNHFKQLRGYLTGREPEVSYREMAEAIGMNEGSVKVAVHRLRKRYGQCLRAEIADTVADPADIDDEVRHLLTSLRPRPVTGM